LVYIKEILLFIVPLYAKQTEKAIETPDCDIM
jgi:hypothetical protein